MARRGVPFSERSDVRAATRAARFVVRPDQRGPELEQHIPDPCALSLASLVLATFLHAGLKLALAFHSLYRWAGAVPVAMFRMECIE